MLLKNYSIPRDNMLMRYCKVSKTGEFERRGNEKIHYAGMMEIRKILTEIAAFGFSRVCTIATRYSLVRT